MDKYEHDLLKDRFSESFKDRPRVLSSILGILNDVDFLPAPDSKIKTLDDIMRWVTSTTCQSVDRIKSKSRKTDIVVARKFFCYAAYTLFKGGVSLKEIGRYLGDRDHTTVIHGRDSVLYHIKKKHPSYVILLSKWKNSADQIKKDNSSNYINYANDLHAS